MTELYCPRCDRSFGADLERCPHDDSLLVGAAHIAQSDPLIGQVIDGRYTITERLGGGGMGVVYRARQAVIEADVALKVVAPHLFERSDAARRFMREARLSSRIKHRNIVSANDFGRTEDGRYFLVTDYVPGRTLSEVIRSGGPIARERAVHIATQLCDALAAAHAAGVVHRDLKPGNVMLIADEGPDRVRVLDFGLARSLTDSGTPLTTAGAVLGTAAYLPPEQALGRVPDGRGDLYALGCMLYEMLTGQPPFAHVRSIAALAMHHAQFPPPPLPDSVPPVLANVVLRLLAKDAEDRYPSAAATRAALEAALEAAVDFDPAPLPTETFVRSTRLAVGTTLDAADPTAETAEAAETAVAGPTGEATVPPTISARRPLLEARDGPPSTLSAARATDIVAPRARPRPAAPDARPPWGLWLLAALLAGVAIWLLIDRMRPVQRSVAVTPGLAPTAPGSSGAAEEPADGRAAAGPDASPDAAVQAAVDAEVDAAVDAAVDAEVDAAADPPPKKAATADSPPKKTRRAARRARPRRPTPAAPAAAPTPAAAPKPAAPPSPLPVDLEALAIDPAAE